MPHVHTRRLRCLSVVSPAGSSSTTCSRPTRAAVSTSCAAGRRCAWRTPRERRTVESAGERRRGLTPSARSSYDATRGGPLLLVARRVPGPGPADREPGADGIDRQRDGQPEREPLAWPERARGDDDLHRLIPARPLGQDMIVVGPRKGAGVGRSPREQLACTPVTNEGEEAIRPPGRCSGRIQADGPDSLDRIRRNERRSWSESMTVRVTVRNGRIVVDEPTDLPDGTVLDLVIDDEGDDLDETQRAALHAAISRSWRQALAGMSAPGEEILERLRARRGS